MKIFLIVFLSMVFSWAHPVSYNIDLKVEFDEVKKEATIYCKSDSRNKCGLHNFHFLDKDESILKTARFPFLKDKITIDINQKPAKMIFFLRKIPEHTYQVIID